MEEEEEDVESNCRGVDTLCADGADQLDGFVQVHILTYVVENNKSNKSTRETNMKIVIGQYCC